MAKSNHPGAHKYMRVKLGKKAIFKCQLPGCTHMLTHPEMAVGRESICWRCGNTFIIVRNDQQFYAKKLKCGECQPINLTEKFEETPVAELLSRLGIEDGEESK